MTYFKFLFVFISNYYVLKISQIQKGLQYLKKKTIMNMDYMLFIPRAYQGFEIFI